MTWKVTVWCMALKVRLAASCLRLAALVRALAVRNRRGIAQTHPGIEDGVRSSRLVIEFILRFATLSLPGKFKDNFAIVLIVFA